jgi:phenylalanyl-tRNA synthetase beta chain
MPTIEFNKDDLFDLVGEELTDEELEEELTRVKVEVEEIDDDRVEAEITSDRIDLLSVEGIARNLRSSLGIEPGLKKYDINTSDYEFHVEKVDARPHVVTAVVEGVELDTPAVKSLIQLQEKLHGTYGRDRKRVSIGLHDMRDIVFPLTYTAAAPAEYRFVPLNRYKDMSLEEVCANHEKGQDYCHLVEEYDLWPVIVDDNDDVLSFPPVINAKRTEVNTSTEDIFIDVTGTDPESLRYALNVIVTALVERGGEIYEVEMHAPGDHFMSPDFSTQERNVDLSFLADILGVDLDQEEARDYLEKVGYGVIKVGEQMEVVIPPYRADILHDVDIAEDLAIGYGYNNITPELPDIATIGQEDEIEQFMHELRELMVGFGYQEVMNPTLSDENTLLDLANRESDDIIELENPVSEKYALGRDMLLPQLLSTLSDNTHNAYPQQVFETADVILRDDEQAVKTRTDKHLAAVSAGRGSDYNELRSELEGLLEALDVEPRFERKEHGTFIEGRCAAIMLDDQEIGVIGEIHPEALHNFGIEMPVTAFELDLDTLRELE